MPLPLEQLQTGSEAQTLTSDERNWIREVLGVSKSSSDKIRQKTEKRFDEFEDYENKSMRYWMLKYEVESEDEDTTLIDAEGADISPMRTRERIVRAMYNLVFASNSITPLENINIDQYRETESKVKFVSIKFNDEERKQSEY